MSQDVAIVFDILLEEIENSIDELSQEGARAFQNKDLATANRLANKGEQITTFRTKVVDLQEEWNRISRGENFSRKRTLKNDIKKNKKIKRLKHGLRTSKDSYYEPILRALVTMGGKGSVKDVLKLVENSMKSEFNQYDLEPLKSGNLLRWENAANWARMDMVRQGLLASNSERGIWQITEKGKACLVVSK